MENNRANTSENRHSSLEMFEHQWPQVRGQIKGWWDRLTDTDLEQVAGQKSQLIHLVQQKYGYARERAEQEVDRRLRDYYDTTGTSGTGTAAGLAAKAGAVGTKMQGMATAAANSVTGRVSGAGTYLQDVPGDFVGFIRRYPIPSLLVGLGVGFLLARSLGQGMMRDRQVRAREREEGYPDATIQCLRCGQMVLQSDMVSHSATCPGTGTPVGHGGSPT
jgi:uncharacterized protein YjbJ (UPF0337 family)